jgi:NAD(P) transhydrogenase subunit alpha
MRIGVPTETAPGECRVGATPESVAKLISKGFSVEIERGAGALASYPDEAYVAAGATLVDDAWGAELVVKVLPPSLDEAARLEPGARLVSLLHPAENADLVQRLKERHITAWALDAVPRISRAQKCDVLSSMANIAGYRAIVEAATHYGGFFSAQITAAGKAPPAKVLIIGAGVAGLAAIGAARGLGADVRAFDTRLAAKEQVESLGAKFLVLDFSESGEGAGGYAKVMSDAFIAAEMAMFRAQAQEVDVVVTTALIPGRKAPILWTRDMVESMKPGSVVVDLAARNGGNCELTEPGQVTRHGGVTLVGHTDLTSRLPNVASRFFAANIGHFLDEVGQGALDLDNEIVRDALVTHGGEVLWPPPQRPPPSPTAAPAAKKLDEAPKAAPRAAPVAAPPKAGGHGHHAPSGPSPLANVGLLALAAVLGAAGWGGPSELLQHLTVFVLACFVGFQVVWNVTPALHTPLMSVTNAVSGIIVVGGVLQASTGRYDAAAVLGAVAVLVATINIGGGFLVTQRMLQMFRR